MRITLNNKMRGYSPTVQAGTLTATTVMASGSGFSIGQLVAASVVSGLIVWGITTWLEGGTR